MAELEKRSFAGEMQAMFAALQRAGAIASSLQELYEAEVRTAVTEITAKVSMLEQQVSNGQKHSAPPQQNMQPQENMSETNCHSCNSLTGAVGEYAVEQVSTGEKQQNMQESPHGQMSVANNRSCHSVPDTVGEQAAEQLPNGQSMQEPPPGQMSDSSSRSCRSLLGAVGEYAAELLEGDPPRDEHRRRDMSRPASGKSHTSEHSLVASSEKCILEQASLTDTSTTELLKATLYFNDDDGKDAKELNSATSDKVRRPKPPRQSSGSRVLNGTHSTHFAISLRDFWVGTKHEPLALLRLRCFVNVVHYDEGNGRPFGRSKSRLPDMQQAMISLHMARLCRSIRSLACDIMHPLGSVRFFWNFLCLLLIKYDIIVVPLQVFDLRHVEFLRVMEWILTIYWTLDVYMTFRTGYTIGSRVEMRPKEIARNYIYGWLVIDIIIVTTEWISRLFVAFGSASLLRSSRALRILRCIKLFRASKLLLFWKALRDKVNSNVMHLCITMLVLGDILLLVIHFTACIWYGIGESREDSWTAKDRYEGEKSNFFWYMASFRWVVAQFNGRTDMDERRNMLERFFTCLVGVTLAVAANAILVSFITKTMLDLSEIVSEKTRRQRAVNQYLEANPVPGALVLQVKRCLRDYQDAKEESKKEDEVLTLLPAHLQTDVLEEVRGPVLMQHPFFCALPNESPWVMRMICSKVVEIVSASKHEVLFDKGDICERMLFTNKLTGVYGDRRQESEAENFEPGEERQTVRSGTQFGVKLVASPYSKTLQKVRAGHWVSEAAIWVEWRNQGCLVSNDHGVLLAVGAAKLASELKKHPHAAALAHLHAKNFESELGKQERWHISDILLFEVQVFSPLCLDITIVNAHGLRNADAWVNGLSDPYAVCKAIDVRGKYDKPFFKTKTKKNTLNPVWNHCAQVQLSWHQAIEFQIYDEDFASRDELLGMARISPEELIAPGFEGDLNLKTLDGTPDQGILRVKIQFGQWENPILSWKSAGRVNGRQRSLL